jgi:hypothetical protein
MSAAPTSSIRTGSIRWALWSSARAAKPDVVADKAEERVAVDRDAREKGSRTSREGGAEAR